MKYYILFLSACFSSICSFAQVGDAPVLSHLAKIKSYSEAHFKIWMSKESLSSEHVNRSSLSNKDLYKIKIDSLNKLLEFVEKYNQLQYTIDEVIVQLKGDMVMANSKKLLKQLNQNIKNPNSWYGQKFKQINDYFTSYVSHSDKSYSAAFIPDITGLFTAVSDVISSARDHRLELVKLLIEQLESLRLKPYYELIDEPKGKG